jgi:transcriptional regulator with XRE-family HTH domain
VTPEDLKQWRELNGYSQMKLAAALRVSRVTVTRWETGVREIPSFLGLALAGLEAMDAEKKSKPLNSPTRSLTKTPTIQKLYNRGKKTDE